MRGCFAKTRPTENSDQLSQRQPLPRLSPKGGPAPYKGVIVACHTLHDLSLFQQSPDRPIYKPGPAAYTDSANPPRLAFLAVTFPARTGGRLKMNDGQPHEVRIVMG